MKRMIPIIGISSFTGIFVCLFIGIWFPVNEYYWKVIFTLFLIYVLCVILDKATE